MPAGRPKNMVKYEAAVSIDDMLRAAAEKIKSQAREPNMLGYRPHVKQQAFHNSAARRRLYIGGNRSGKTTGGIVEDLYWVTRRHPHRRIPSDIKIYGRVIAVDFNLVKQNIHKQLKRWILPSDLINGSWEDSYSQIDKLLTLENGSTIDFKSYDQDVDQHASVSLHFVHFDEPPPKVLYTENNLRLLDRYGDFEGSGSWWMTYTPIFGMDWTYDEIYLPGMNNPQESGIDVIEVDMDDNPYLTEEAKRDVLQGYSEDEVTARKKGRYVQLGGNVFKEFGPQHVINEADLFELWASDKPPTDWLLYWSLDHGLNAPTAIYWHAVGPDGSIITFHEIYQNDTLVHEFAKMVNDYESKLGRVPDYRTGDPAIKQRSGITGTSIQQAYMEHGIYIAVDSVPKDGSIGITKMRQHMRTNPKTRKPYWRIYNSPNLVKELERLHWKTFTSLKIRDDNNPMEVVHKKNDHGFDSCKYFFTFMPDLKPEEIGTTRLSDFDPNSLVAAISKDHGPVPGPVRMPWRIANRDTNDYGMEPFDE